MPDKIHFTVTSKWCTERIVLRDSQWRHTIRRHPEMTPYMNEVRLTLEDPRAVYETYDLKPTLAYYKRNLIDDPPYRGCYVAVFVRYKMSPAHVWTAYLPSHTSSNPGNLLHLGR